MNWLQRLLGRPQLPPGLAARIAAWQALPAPDLSAPLKEASVVIVDVETTGLNPYKDLLLAIGAVTVNGARIAVGQGFDLVLRRDGRGDPGHLDKENILVHGISPTELSEGVPVEEALVRFLEYVGKRPLVAYHSPFDEMVLGRALKQHLGVKLPNRWMDLCWLAPALVPEANLVRKSLDAWLDRYGLRAFQRHRALSDCIVTAELLLVLYRQAQARGIKDFDTLAGLAQITYEYAKAGGQSGF